MKPAISKIVKRDGSVADFDKSKISVAIDKAFKATGEKDGIIVKRLADDVVKILEKRFAGSN